MDRTNWVGTTGCGRDSMCASIDAAAMELARTNLLHRCLLEGSLVEREK